MGKLFAVVTGLAVLVVLIALGPLLILWSLNTLFPALAIPYTFWTWLAALFLASALKAKVKVNRK